MPPQIILCDPSVICITLKHVSVASNLFLAHLYPNSQVIVTHIENYSKVSQKVQKGEKMIWPYSAQIPDEENTTNEHKNSENIKYFMK